MDARTGAHAKRRPPPRKYARGRQWRHIIEWRKFSSARGPPYERVSYIVVRWTTSTSTSSVIIIYKYNWNESGILKISNKNKHDRVIITYRPIIFIVYVLYTCEWAGPRYRTLVNFFFFHFFVLSQNVIILFKNT